MITGIISGVIAAAIVWVLGYTFAGPSLTKHDQLGFGTALLLFMRGALFIASAVVLGVLAAVSLSNGDFTFFKGFALSYLVGVFAYFMVRYRPRIRLDRR